jgi:hypothetical protein
MGTDTRTATKKPGVTDDERKRGRPFPPGQSGNPNGRPRGTSSRPRHLPIDVAVAATQLAQQGVTERQIAKLLHARPEAVKDALTGARRVLDSLAPQFVRDWARASEIAAENGDHKPALSALLSSKVIEPAPQVYDTGASSKAVAAVKVEIHNFSFAGLPQQPEDSVINVTATDAKRSTREEE